MRQVNPLVEGSSPSPVIGEGSRPNPSKAAISLGLRQPHSEIESRTEPTQNDRPRLPRATRGATGTRPDDPDLAAVVTAWPKLPEAPCRYRGDGQGRRQCSVVNGVLDLRWMVVCCDRRLHGRVSSVLDRDIGKPHGRDELRNPDSFPPRVFVIRTVQLPSRYLVPGNNLEQTALKIVIGKRGRPLRPPFCWGNTK